MQESFEIFKKINTLTIEYAIKIHQSKCTLMKSEMGKDGDQSESSKIQRTTRVSLPSAETSLPRSLCLEMCMICKKKDLKLKQSRKLQSKIVTRTSEKLLKEVIVVSETYLIAHQFHIHEKCYLDYTRIIRKSSSVIESTSEETCSGNRD